MLSRRLALSLIGSAGLVPTATLAQGQPSLKITGRIAKPGLVMDRNAIETIGLVAFDTMTPWYNTKVRFEGVPVSKLLKTIGANGEKLVATALNDYVTEIPITDFDKYEVILATKRDGIHMPISDKGPFFIVYNFDSNVELKSKIFYSRSAWQVASIDVR